MKNKLPLAKLMAFFTLDIIFLFCYCYNGSLQFNLDERTEQAVKGKKFSQKLGNTALHKDKKKRRNENCK
jgi:hypothetical protein